MDIYPINIQDFIYERFIILVDIHSRNINLPVNSSFFPHEKLLVLRLNPYNKMRFELRVKNPFPCTF